MTLISKVAAKSPIARFESGVAMVAGKMFVIGGHLEPNLSATSAVLCYCPIKDVWSHRQNAPAQISHVNAVVTDDRYIWLAGGYVGQHPGEGISKTFRYDTHDDVWFEAHPLPMVRASGGFAAIGKNLHYFGGLGSDRYTNFSDHWIYDTAECTGWEKLRPIPYGRTHAATAVEGDMIYAIGGHFGHDVPGQIGVIDKQPDLDYVHRYNFKLDEWDELEPLPHRRSHCEPGTFVFDGKIYCVGGRSAASLKTLLFEKRSLRTRLSRIFRKTCRKCLPGMTAAGVDDIICYDPNSNEWERIGSLGHELYAPAATCINGEIIVTNGGRNVWQNPTDETLSFNLSKFL